MLVKSLKADIVLAPFYNGGKVVLSHSEEFLVCSFGTQIHVVDAVSGQVRTTLEGDTETVLTFGLAPTDDELVSISRSLIVRVWDLATKECKKTWKVCAPPLLSCTDWPGACGASWGASRCGTRLAATALL